MAPGSVMASRLWYNLTQAINAKDMEKATEAKMAVEEAQREQRKQMEEHGTKHVQTFFEERGGRWVPKIEYVSSSLSSLFNSSSFRGVAFLRIPSSQHNSL